MLLVHNEVFELPLVIDRATEEDAEQNDSRHIWLENLSRCVRFAPKARFE